MKLKITYDGPGSQRFQRRFNAAKKVAWTQLGIYWHKALRPKHFTQRGATEYGYTARAGQRGSGKAFRRSYQGQKLKIKGHTRPLVYSGDSQKLTRLRIVRPLPKGRGVRVPLRAPALNFSPKGGRLNMAAEMTTISQPEGIILTRLFNGWISRWLQRNSN